MQAWRPISKEELSQLLEAQLQLCTPEEQRVFEFSDRGLSPHKFMPVLGVHMAFHWTHKDGAPVNSALGCGIIMPSLRFANPELQARFLAGLKQLPFAPQIADDGSVVCTEEQWPIVNDVAHKVRDACFKWYFSWCDTEEGTRELEEHPKSGTDLFSEIRRSSSLFIKRLYRHLQRLS